MVDPDSLSTVPLYFHNAVLSNEDNPTMTSMPGKGSHGKESGKEACRGMGIAKKIPMDAKP